MEVQGMAGDVVSSRRGHGEDPEATVSKRIYREYSSAQQKWAKQASDALKLYNGVHWTAEQKAVLDERGQSATAVQATYQLVDQAVGMLSANNPRFNAAAREDSDVKDAAFVRQLLQWGWQVSRGKERYKTSLQDYYVQGRGVLYLYVDPNDDYGKGEVKFIDLDPKEVFPDPNSRDRLWDDAAHVIVRRILTGEQININWPHFDLTNVKQEDGQPYSTGDRDSHNDEQIFPEDINDAEHRKYEVIERYTKIKQKHYRVFNADTGREDVLNEEDFQARQQDLAFVVVERGVERIVTNQNETPELQGMLEAYGPISHLMEVPGPPDEQGMPTQPSVVRVPGPETESGIQGSTLELIPTTYGDLVETGALPSRPFLMDRIKVVSSIGDKLLFEPFILKTCHYPVIVFNNTHNRNPYPIGDVARMKDLQDVVNKSLSLILAHAANTTNQKVFVPVGAIGDKDRLEQEWSRAGSAFIEYDPGMGERGGIVIASPAPLPNELYTNMDRALQMMERIVGVFSTMQGDPSTAPATFKGTMAIDEFGARRMKSKMDDLYGALARLGQVYLDLAQATFTQEKMIRLFQPDGSVSEETLNVMQYDDYGLQIGRINDITVGRYDVMIQAGSTLPSNRWAMLEEYKELFTLGLVDQVAVLKRAEIPDAEQILQRAGQMQQMQQMMQQMEEEIKNLKGDLQTAERAEINSRKRVEVEKHKANLKNTEANFAKSAEIFDAQLNMEIEKQKAIQQQVQKTNERTAARQLLPGNGSR